MDDSTSEENIQINDNGLERKNDPINEVIHPQRSLRKQASPDSKHQLVKELINIFSLIIDKLFNDSIIPDSEKITGQCQQIMRSLASHIIM